MPVPYKMETQDSLDIRALKQLILGPIPEPTQVAETRDVQIACSGVAARDGGCKLDDTIDHKHVTCTNGRQHESSGHDNSQAQARSPQIPSHPVAAKEGPRAQPPPKKMSTQGSEEKTQEIGEEELAELARKVQEEHVQHSSIIEEDEVGHIDLLKSFEQSRVDRYDEEEDNDDDFGVESQARAEIFPESKRFQQPVTPATGKKNQIHARNPDGVTPGLPSNPFAQSAASSTGIIPMSQAFNYTQPSSPHRRVFPSDPASELPSPAVFNAFRSPVLPASSSPTSLATVAKDVAAKGLGGRKVHRRRRSPPTNCKTEEESSDDGFDRSAEEERIKWKLAIQKIDEETRRQFEMVTAPSREPANARGRRRGKEKPKDKVSNDKSHKISLIPDEAGKVDTEADGDTTEDESDNTTKARRENENAIDAARNVQTSTTNPHAELGERQAAADQRSLPTYRQRQPTRRRCPEDEHTSIPSSEQPPPTKGHASLDQPQGAGLSAISQVVEVENSQPSLSQAKPEETQHSSVSALLSLPSSLGSGFLVSRSQDDDFSPLPRTNGSFEDRSGEQSSYLPQPPNSLVALGGSSPLGSQSRSEGLSLIHRKSGTFSQSHAADDTHHDLENRQTIIERSSPPLFTAKVVYNDPILSTIVVENSGSIEESDFPRPAANGGHLENLGMREVRTPLNTKPFFSANETTIPETSPAVGRASRLPLHEHLNRTPQPSPIPPPKDNRWSQDATGDQQYTNQSSGSNLFETARSRLSPSSTGLMHRHSQNNSSSRQAASHINSATRDPKGLITDMAPSDRLSEAVGLIMGNSEDTEDKVLSKEISLTPANKRRKGIGGLAIPDTEAKARPPTAGMVAEPSGNQGEHSPSAGGQIKVPEDVATIDRGKRKTLGLTEKVKAPPKETGYLGNLNPSPVVIGSKIGGASGGSLAPKLVSRTKISRSIPSKPQRADRASLQHTLAPDPKQHDVPAAITVEPSLDPSVIEPNRVLALFKNGNMSYYPATCRFAVGIGNPRFKVRFDDGTEDLLEPQNVRRFDLRLGDVVKVDLDNMRTKNYVVCGFQDCKAKNIPFVSPRRNRGDRQDYPATDIRGYSTIFLQQKQRDSFPNEGGSSNGEEIAVPISSVYIVKSMWHKFDDRIYTHISDFPRPSSRGQTPGSLSSNPVTPTHNRRITPSALVQAANSDSLGAIPRHTNGIFKGMVFAVTYLNEEAEKEQIVNEIVDNGGKVLHDGFEELFLADWFTAASGDYPSLRLKREAEKFGFACVVANNYSRKPKFMGALALGLPCLHGRWIKDCTRKNEVVDWDPYLLPSGESNYLGGSARSRVLHLYPPLTAQLPDTIASRPKPLDGQSVILVMGKGKAEDRRKAFLFLIFALGAGKVSKVPNLEAAKRFLADSQSERDGWDWVCLDDGHVKDARKALGVPGKKRKRSVVDGGDVESEIGFSKVKIMSDEYVMQTTIMGRLMAE
ncbi:hypothetical protein FGG08_003308 [Glutinoglossum americanum]|uniref:BRCT domain-containing protein n=1 Tax=Glutinoglossum americanum TaxID=1670608 RepID=A0A9P8KY92_9PEZI|nr:hypothetical protein FGG08_003308 [Glutinoglossum americanum]